MSEEGQRSGAVRDVPPPRPVTAGRGAPSSDPVEESGTPLGRAARVVADTVSGWLGNDSAAEPAPGERRVSAAGLRELAAAFGGAVAAWRTRRTAPTSEVGGEREEWSPGAFLTDLLSSAVPRLPIRDGARLRQAYPGASDDEIAEALVARSARLTAGIGAATGGLSAVQWMATPSLIALPVELGTETVLVAAVEVVLLGELHELYGRGVEGDGRARAAAYLSSWSAQRAIDDAAGPGVVSVLGAAGLHALRRRLTRRVARTVPSMAPFFLGAALGGRGNRRATEALARRVLTDLQHGRPPGGPPR